MKHSSATLVDLLREHATARPNALAYRFLDFESVGGGAEEWTYAHIDRAARAIAACLQETACVGDRAMLLYPSGLEFIAAFLGCLYAGVIAVPAYPPNPGRPDRAAGRLRHIAMNCEPTLVLTTERLVESRAKICESAPEFAAARWIATKCIDAAAAEGWTRPGISGQSIAFLQYTSGSTGDPKGVINRHANILSNEECIAFGFESDGATHVVGWLPLFHDMGLIGNVLHPLYMGGSGTLMSPAAFLKRPLNWLAAVSRYRGTISGGPNFAYDLCSNRIAPEDREALDLSGWYVAYTGSEPVRGGFCTLRLPQGVLCAVLRTGRSNPVRHQRRPGRLSSSYAVRTVACRRPRG
jgi:acyl-CoA synthetase (AMP-forming)/AMP-acid ligase II